MPGFAGTQGTPEVIFDCCVPSNFALVEALLLLKRVHAGDAFLTGFVYAEILRGIQTGHHSLTAVKAALTEEWIQEVHPTAAAEKRLFESLSQSLGLGEASSLALAKARNLVFAFADRAAGREACLLEVRLTGTTGILVKFVRSGALRAAQADRLLDRMTEQGFFSPVRSLRYIPD